MGRRLYLSATCDSDAISGLTHEAVGAGAVLRAAGPGLPRVRTAFQFGQAFPPRERGFYEMDQDTVEEKRGDGRLCVRGTPGCSRKKITDPVPHKLNSLLDGASGLADGVIGNLANTFNSIAKFIPGVGPVTDGLNPATSERALTRTKWEIDKAVEEAALRGQGEGAPPVDPQTGPAVRVSDLWKWVSNVQMRRAKKAALIADSAVQEAWKQQRLARYYSHEALVAEAAAIRALPRSPEQEQEVGPEPQNGVYHYSVPPEMKKFYERQKMPPGLELPPTPLVNPPDDKMVFRVTSRDAAPALLPLPPRELREGPRRLRPPPTPAAFL
mmetsp:Transcript_48436/g.149642  ORF Transcript_48436/g.149642 Transcript_48436/m.149642 type:complete len:327 (+) Transcript_48436:84-1064(+)